MQSPRGVEVVRGYHAGDPRDLREHVGCLSEHFAKYSREVEHNVQDQSYHSSDFEVDIAQEFSRHWTFCMLIWSAFLRSAHVLHDDADRWLQHCQSFPQQQELLQVIDELTRNFIDHPSGDQPDGITTKIDQIASKVAQFRADLSKTVLQPLLLSTSS
jgi:hypothetical protein